MGQTGVIEQVFDQCIHARGCRANAYGVASPLFVESIGVILEKDAAETLQSSQRRAQVVGNCVTDTLKRFHTLIEDSSPFGHLRLELLGVTADSLLGFGQN